MKTCGGKVKNASEEGLLVHNNLEKNSVYFIMFSASGYRVNSYLVGVLDNDNSKAFEIVPEYTRRSGL